MAHSARLRGAPPSQLELAVCVLLLAVAHRRAPALARRLLPAIWVVLVAGHYLDVTAPGLYGREFNLYWDSQHLGNVAAMLARRRAMVVDCRCCDRNACWRLPWPTSLARLAIWPGGTGDGKSASAIALGALAAIALVLLFAGQRFAGGFPIDVAFADPVTPAYAAPGSLRAGDGRARCGGPARSDPARRSTPAFARITGVDVLLIFVESYGAITYETPAISAGLAASRAEFDAAIRDSGRQVVSAYVESPTFGGSSWLAHLSLLSGVEVRDQYAYTALMASRRDTIITNFARRGYRTVALMPGMRQAWPEGAFYGFDVIYGRDDLDYEGPQFGWWSIPDQYALARLDALERRQCHSRSRYSSFFPRAPTHAPFGPGAAVSASLVARC